MSVEQWDGRPQNPERDGWHWLRNGLGCLEALRWGGSAWGCYAGAPQPNPTSYTYLNPCLTPSEVAAREEAARREEREACARHLENWPVEDERMVADECAAAIRARGDA